MIGSPKVEKFFWGVASVAGCIYVVGLISRFVA